MEQNLSGMDLGYNLDYDLDSDPEDVPVYTRYLLFNTT